MSSQKMVNLDYHFTQVLDVYVTIMSHKLHQPTSSHLAQILDIFH